MNNNLPIQKEVVICTQCNGTGNEWHVLRTSGHDSEQQQQKCTLCGGSGRLVKETTIVYTLFHEGVKL